MINLLKLLLVSFVLLCLSILASFVFRENILLNENSSALKTFVVTFMKPADYYQPIINENIDLSNKDKMVKDVVHKYPGTYMVSLEFENLPYEIMDNTEGFQPSYIIRIRMTEKDKQAREFLLKDGFSSFMTKKGIKLVYSTYKCPNSIPLSSNIKLEIEVVEEDRLFEEKYGPAFLTISKKTDK